MGFPGIRGVRCKSYALKCEKIKTKSKTLDFGATCWQIKSCAGNWEVDPFVLHSLVDRYCFAFLFASKPAVGSLGNHYV